MIETSDTVHSGNQTNKLDLVLVTGMSGAGRSSALKSLEDLGFEAIDNLPLALLPRLSLGRDPTGRAKPLAVGVDVRSRDFSPDMLQAEIELVSREKGLRVKTLFLECDNSVLIRRYTETRRRHPLAADRPIEAGLAVERRILAPMRDKADLVIDTSELTIWSLKQRLTTAFRQEQSAGLTVTIMSFSYRKGIPRDADLVFDVRFLRNPHYDNALRSKTGLDKSVGSYITADQDYEAFWTSLCNLIKVTLPRYADEGKSYLTIAFGCTGGKHRSVFLTEALTGWLKNQEIPCTAIHRDIPPAPTEST